MYQNANLMLQSLADRLSVIEKMVLNMESITEIKARLLEMEDKLYSTKRVMNFDEVCKYIGISQSALYKMTSAGVIPFHKPRGKMLYFDKTEIDEWLLQNRNETVAEKQSRADALVSQYHIRTHSHLHR